MTAEQLNIKLNLDISDITAGVKKVKTQLSGMADKVKQSIPKIDSESKKAKKSLEQVGDAGDDVKKSIANIGTEAQKSLSGVVSQSKKISQAFKDIKTSSANAKIGVSTEDYTDSIDGTSESLEGLQDTVQQILQLNFIGAFKNVIGLTKFKSSIDVVKESVSGLKSSIENAKSAYNEFFVDQLSSFDFNEYVYDENGEIVDVIQRTTKEIEKAIKSQSKFSKEVKKTKEQVKESWKAIGKSVIQVTKSVGLLIIKVGLLASAFAAVGGALIANSTKQFREEQTKLNSAFSAAGASAEEASQAYNNLFRFLGESSRSVESANHLAKITTNTQHLAEWTTICQGIYATFGDSLPIESLTEAANETIRVSKVTGVMADALNWAGVSEDAFNAQLEKTTSLTEREALVRRTLMGLYQNAAAIYEQNNKAIIAQNEAQARLDKTMARIGQQTQVLVTSWINLKNTIMTVLAPAITYISAIFSVLIDKLATAIQWVGKLIGIEFKTDAVSGIVSGVSDVSSGIENATGATGGLTDGLNKATEAAEKLRRVTMGFDELNIVSDLSSKSSSTDSGSSGTGTGAGGGISSIDTGNSMIGKIGEQIEDVKAKVEDFFEKWKTQIAIISAALAALGIAGLLDHLGKAIGLGDTFLKTMKTIKNLAVSAIVITLQYSLVNDYMDKYIDGKDFKDYIKGLLVAAIGTGVLYAMWGTAGLAIGLGVTAVASIKAVIDNGGINSVESAVVALTGLVSAIGAVAAGWKTLKGLGIGSTLSNLLPKISGIGKAVSGVIGTLGGGTLAIIAAAVAAVASAVYFLYQNWEEVTKAVKNFFNENIVPKLEKIKDSFNNIKDSLKSLIPENLLKKLQDIGNAIKDIVSKIGEWIKQIDWIKAIGKAFEAVGGVIVSLFGGTIAGLLNAVISKIQATVEHVEAVVQIFKSSVQVIVALFQGDLQKARDAFEDLVEGVVKFAKSMYDRTIGVVVNFVKGIIDWFVKLWDELVGHSIVPDMVEAIIEWFNKLYDNTIGVIIKFAKDVAAKFTEMWNNIKSWFTSNVAPKFTKEYWANHFDTIRQSASEKLDAAKKVITGVWDAVKAWFTTNVAPKFTKQYWTTKFDTIRQAIDEKLNAAKKAIADIWNLLKNWFTTNVAPKFTKQYWDTKFDTIRQAANAKINAIKGVFTNAWNTVAGWFRTSVAPKFTVNYWTTKFNTIKDGARAAFNGVISIVERAVNAIITKINTLSWTIPDWVPMIGGRKFGFNFRAITIPRLATGGIATSSTLVNVGEKGKEAILPLENNTAWMDILANKIAARQGNAPTKVSLVIDGKELGWATINNINAITKQTGGLQLAL